MTLIEDDLRLKVELQDVKHQFAGLLDNFRSLDKALQSPRFRENIAQGHKSATDRMEDARSRIRDMYAARRAIIHRAKQEADKENANFRRMTPILEHGGGINDRKRPRIQGQCRPIYEESGEEKTHRGHSTTREYDTSVWSEADSAYSDRPHQVDINDISCISGQRVLREHTSGANIHHAGGSVDSSFNYPLHSTLNYPLHSTILEQSDNHISDISVSPLVNDIGTVNALRTQQPPPLRYDELVSRDEHIRVAGYHGYDQYGEDEEDTATGDSNGHLRRQNAKVRLSINQSDSRWENSYLDLTTNATCHTILAGDDSLNDNDDVTILRNYGDYHQNNRHMVDSGISSSSAVFCSQRYHSRVTDRTETDTWQRYYQHSTCSQPITTQRSVSCYTDRRAYRLPTTHSLRLEKPDITPYSNTPLFTNVTGVDTPTHRPKRRKSSSKRRSGIRPSCLRPLTTSIVESSFETSTNQNGAPPYHRDMRETVRRRLREFNRRSSYSDVHVQTLAHF